jgi:hypothetical protein
MQEFFDQLFDKYHLTAEQKKKFSEELNVIIFMMLLKDLSSQLSSEEMEKLKIYGQKKEYENFFSIIKDKYFQEQWDKFLVEKVTPLIENYSKNVLEV